METSMKWKIQNIADNLIRVWHCLFLLMAVIMWGAVFPQTATAAQVIVTCTDVNDSNSCRIDTQGSFSQNTFEVFSDLLTTANNNSASGVCTQNPAQGNLFDCNVSGNDNRPVLLQCDVQGNSASCQFQNNPSLLSVNCQETGPGGQCIVDTNPEAFASTLDDGAFNNLVGFSGNLLSGCASLAGTAQFQEDCAALLDGINNNNPLTANTTRAIAPVNSDAPIYSATNFVSTGLSHLHRRLVYLRQSKVNAPVEQSAALQQNPILQQNPVSLGYDYHRSEYANASANARANVNHSYALQALRQSHLPANDALGDFTSNAVETPLASSGLSSRLGVFVDGSVVGSETGDQAFENGSDQTAGIVTWGVDYRYTPDFTAGIAFSTASSTTDYSANGGDLSDLGYLLLAFGSYYNGNWYVDSSLGIGGNSYEQSRRLQCEANQNCLTDFNQVVSANFGGSQFSFGLAAGYDFRLGRGITVSPFASVNATSVSIDGYREQASNPDAAGAGFALELDEQSRTTALLSAGIRSSYPISTSTLVAVPHASLEVISAPNDDALTVSGRFAGNPNGDEQFEITNRVVENSYLLANLGSVFQLKQGTSAFVNANFVFGNSRNDRFQLTAGFRWEL